MLNYTGISREMITEALVGRKVFDVRGWREQDETPPFGTVVSGNQQQSVVWVVFSPLEEPKRYAITNLMLVKQDMNLAKTMKWSGKTLGALEKFCEQVRVEGGDEDTALNPDRAEHVAIVVKLPLATKPEGDKTQLIGDGRVVGEVASS